MSNTTKQEFERALINTIRNDDTTYFREYIKRDKGALPKDDFTLMVSLYKVALAISTIPNDVKEIAHNKCLELNISPVIDFNPITMAGVASILEKRNANFDYYD